MEAFLGIGEVQYSKFSPTIVEWRQNSNLLHFLFQVQKMVKIGIGCTKIQITWGRNKILDARDGK